MSGNYGILGPIHESQEAIMDIIFVHGLHGDRTETWTHKGNSNDEDVLWPQDLLAKDTSNTRSFSYGYDANIVSFTSQPSENSISNHADNLVAAVGGQCIEEVSAKRPVIFVAHRLSGLVCAKAMLHARSSTTTELQNVESCARGIIFLGTPFHGAEKADWGETFRQIMSIGKTTNSKTLGDMRPDSDALSELVHHFAEWLGTRNLGPDSKAETVDCVCFFEEMRTKIPLLGSSSQIVTKESAQIPGYERQSIHANNIDMCKFRSKEDDGYDKTLRVLERWAAKLNSSEKSGVTEPTPHHNTDRVDFSGNYNQGSVFGQAVDGSGPNY